MGFYSQNTIKVRMSDKMSASVTLTPETGKPE